MLGREKPEASARYRCSIERAPELPNEFLGQFSHIDRHHHLMPQLLTWLPDPADAVDSDLLHADLRRDMEGSC